MIAKQADETGAFFRSLQGTVCTALEKVDGVAMFRDDPWKHVTEGGGITRVISDGGVFEKGAVNYSLVSLMLSDVAAQRMNIRQQRISATGMSLILHPRNPFVPTVHANFRYLELQDGTWWFGGGADLTPFYVIDEDIQHFHATLKRTCDAHDRGYYPAYKSWADRYFFLPHRNEARGVGGIFFDDLTGDFEKQWAFVQACGASFLDAYVPIVERRASTPFQERHRTWQLQRRGRYAEFNLRFDRGTHFGLDSGGRVESILASLPPMARWDYDVQIQPGSDEERLVEILRKPKEWT